MKRSGYENVLVWALAGDPRLWLSIRLGLLSGLVLELGERALELQLEGS